MFTFSLDTVVSESAAKAISDKLKSLFTNEVLDGDAHVPTYAIIADGVVTGYDYPDRVVGRTRYMEWTSCPRQENEEWVFIRTFHYV